MDGGGTRWRPGRSHGVLHEPGRLLGTVDEESDLWTAVERSGRFAVTVLGSADRQLADRFAGLLPAPGGLFAGDGWAATDWGPIPVDHPTWAGCRLDAARPVGWALLVEASVEHIEIGDAGPHGVGDASDATAAAGDAGPLLHHRGRYRTL